MWKLAICLLVNDKLCRKFLLSVLIKSDNNLELHQSHSSLLWSIDNPTSPLLHSHLSLWKFFECFQIFRMFSRIYYFKCTYACWIGNCIIRWSGQLEVYFAINQRHFECSPKLTQIFRWYNYFNILCIIISRDSLLFLFWIWMAQNSLFII